MPTLSDYDYDLPEELIAQEPATPRDHSRLLVYNRADQSIRHDHFYNLGQYLHPGTRLVLNNTRVNACRITYENGSREIFLLDERNEEGATMALAMVRPGRRFKPGTLHQIADDLHAEVLAIEESGLRRLRLTPPITDPRWSPFLHTPFPPYIKPNEEFSERYQTVFSKDEGSRAAPTAGLHFTPELLDGLAESGFHTTEVTLHVGLGTFAPVKTEKIEEHEMHSEWWRITEAAAKELSTAPHRTAVGTTSMRVLESQPGTVDQGIQAGSGDTSIFIYPGVPVRFTDSLITNFHLPKSTLLMLVAALTGVDEMHRIYQEAIEQKYRFYSFGDAMLIL